MECDNDIISFQKMYEYNFFLKVSLPFRSENRSGIPYMVILAQESTILFLNRRFLALNGVCC